MFILNFSTLAKKKSLFITIKCIAKNNLLHSTLFFYTQKNNFSKIYYRISLQNPKEIQKDCCAVSTTQVLSSVMLF